MKRILFLIPFFISTSFANSSVSRVSTTVICDTPSEIYHSSNIQGNPYFLNYGGTYPDTYLTVVIWERDISNLEINPYTYFSTGDFCIEGTIETFNRRDQITLRNPDQILRRSDHNKTVEKKLKKAR